MIMQPVPPCSAPSHWWQTWASELLLCWQLQLGALNLCVCVCVCVCVFSPLCCPLRFQNSPQTGLWEGFLLFGNFSFTTASPGWVSLPNSFVSLLSFIFCPTSFWREWAAFLGAWCPPPAFRSCFMEVAQHSNDFLMNCGGETDLLFLFLCHLGTAF